MARLAGRGAAFQIKGPRSIEGQHLHAVLDRLDLHAPITCMSQGMEVAIIHERFQFHFEGRASPHEGVLNEGGVFALAHPHALFQKRIGQRVSPHGSRTFQVKILEE